MASDRPHFFAPASQPAGMSAPEFGRIMADRRALIHCHHCSMSALVVADEQLVNDWHRAHEQEVRG